jgi:hypothetical protein
MRDNNNKMLDELLSGDEQWFHDLVEDVKPQKKPIINDPMAEKFEEVNVFIDKHGRSPDPDADDLRESNLGARLSGWLRSNNKHAGLLTNDRHGLFKMSDETSVENEPIFNEPEDNNTNDLSIDDLLDDPLFSGDDNDVMTSTRAQRPSLLSKERDVWARQPCKDFERFRAKFDTIQLGLEDKSLVRAPMAKGVTVTPGDVFSWKGTLCFIEKEADLDDESKEGRVRVIFANGMESWMKERSITRHFYALRYRGEKKAYVERIIPFDEVQPDLPDDKARDKDVTGYIYVARTLSKNPSVAPFKDGMVKIGVTTGSVKKRIAGAENDPTFLLAKAKIVATFELKNLNPPKVEKRIHEHFIDDQLSIDIEDRFGKKVTANEWFTTTPSDVYEFVKKMLSNEQG